LKKAGTHRAKRKQNSMALRIGLLLLAVMVFFNGYTLAKYFMEKNQKVPVAAKSFYFESDLLAVNTGAIPQYTLQAGEKSISFSLMNYPDALRSSQVDINYTAELTRDGFAPQSKSGTIAAGRNKVSVSFDNLLEGTYLVSVTATTPYSQTLQGRFTIINTSYALSHTVYDRSGSPYLKVTIKTTDFSGNIVVSWPDGVLADNSDPLLRDVRGQSCTIPVNAQSEYTLQFFKTNPSADFTDSITVSKANS